MAIRHVRPPLTKDTLVVTLVMCTEVITAKAGCSFSIPSHMAGKSYNNKCHHLLSPTIRSGTVMISVCAGPKGMPNSALISGVPTTGAGPALATPSLALIWDAAAAASCAALLAPLHTHTNTNTSWQTFNPNSWALRIRHAECRMPIWNRQTFHPICVEQPPPKMMVQNTESNVHCESEKKNRTLCSCP